jgi:acetyltransferase-like isoleucine patch superfamily enzyme
VIEHLPEDELPLFLSEIQRVAKKGYLEFPNVFYEMINFQPVHYWFLNFRDGFILFLNKAEFNSNYVHKCFREIFYGEDDYMYRSFDRFKEFYFFGYEWKSKIDHKIVKDFDELVNETDHKKIKNLISTYKKIENKVNMKFFDKMKNIIKKIYNRFNYRKLPYNIASSAILNDLSLIEIGEHAEIQDYVIIKTFLNKVKIGKYTQINPFTVIYGGNGVYIGDNVMIAPHCMIAAGNHDYKQIEQPIRFARNLSRGPIIIEDNVWIGANCTITDGVRIGRDAVIGANSLVNKDVEPYDLVCGTPARIIVNRKIKYEKN